MKVRLLKNAVANVSRGGAAALVAIFLPPILIRHMRPDAYAVWILILQVVAYLGYLDFGLQTAIGRYFAFATEKQDTAWRDSIFSTALVGLCSAAAIGCVFLGSVAAAAHLIFPQIPVSFLPTMRTAILIVGFAVAIGLPASAANGVFVGLQRYEIPAFTTSIGKTISAAGLIWAALTSRSIIVMAVIVAGSNLLAYSFQFGILRRVAPYMRFRLSLVTRAALKELTGYCVSLTAWSLGMLLINGFDLIMVGRFEFSAVAAYSAAALLVLFLESIQNAVFGVFIPHAAGMHAREESGALGELLLRSTRLGTCLLLLGALPLIVFSHQVIGVWLGASYSNTGGRILTMLLIANVIRLIGTPYSTILIGTGLQRLIVISPLLEGVTNLTASILLGLRYGAIGVAWGTLIGALVGIGCHIVYNMPRTQSAIRLPATSYVSAVIGILGLAAAPFAVAYGAVVLAKQTLTGIWIGALACAMGICLYVLVSNYRHKATASLPGLPFGG